MAFELAVNSWTPETWVFCQLAEDFAQLVE